MRVAETVNREPRELEPGLSLNKGLRDIVRQHRNPILPSKDQTLGVLVRRAPSEAFLGLLLAPGANRGDDVRVELDLAALVVLRRRGHPLSAELSRGPLDGDDPGFEVDVCPAEAHELA